MSRLKTIIVDDEPDALKNLTSIIEKEFDNLTILASASSVQDAIPIIEDKRPELVFLDVELPDGTGFDILKNVRFKNFDTIFVTAHNHYSIKAIKVSALDYILKPAATEDLIHAVTKAIDNHKEKIGYYVKIYDNLLENINSIIPKKIILPTFEGLDFVNIDEIIFIKAEGSYSEIYFSNKKKKTVSKVLKDFHENLYDLGFFRTHNSFLVNLRHIKKLIKRDPSIEMTDGSLIPISKNNYIIFKQIINKYIHFT